MTPWTRLGAEDKIGTNGQAFRLDLNTHAQAARRRLQEYRRTPTP